METMSALAEALFRCAFVAEPARHDLMGSPTTRFAISNERLTLAELEPKLLSVEHEDRTGPAKLDQRPLPDLHFHHFGNVIA